MQKNIVIRNQNLQYNLRKSRRARSMRIEVHDNFCVEIIIPYYVSEKEALIFLNDKSEWILKSLKRYGKRKKLPLKGTREEYLLYKEVARDIISRKVEYWNQVYEFDYNRISVKNMKTQWGSCSSIGNLNYNYKMIFLTESQMDYIVVHELCHLREMNHSHRFWDLVGRAVPEYKNICREIKGLSFK